LRSDGEYEGSIWLEAMGEDGSAEQIALETAELVGTGPLEVEQTKINNVRLVGNESSRLRVKLKQPGKYSLRASLT
jgi:uncharacterized cupredoxin-like copper-binding protein